MKLWRDAHQDHIKAYQKQWREANKDAVRAYQKDYHEEYRARDDVQAARWERQLRENYRMTPEDFNVLWKSQAGQCAVCLVKMNPRGRKPDAACVDHNHETGEIRGLLCRACNHGIGNLKDDPNVLEAAAVYLREKGHYGPRPTLIGTTNHE